MLLSIALSAGTVISETDFTRDGKVRNFAYRAKGFGTFHGFLPKHWRENGAAWQKSATTADLVRDPAGDYLKFTVSGAGTQYYTDLPKLKKGCTYRLHAVIRNKSDGMASVMLRAGKPYKVWTTLPVPFSDDWKTWTKTFRFDQDPDPTIVLFLSLRGNGEFDVRSIRLEEADGENRTLLATDFSSAAKQSEISGKGSFRGVLPGGWKEDYTHFIPSAVTTETGKQGTEKFLRFHIQGAGPQFQAPLENLKAGRYYRLTFSGNNRTGEPIGFSLRQIAAPYTQLAYASANGDSGWKTQVLTFGVGKELPGPAALFMTIRGTGELDLGTLRLEELAEGEVVTKRPDPKLANVLRNSRLPLGLQSGWTQESMNSWNKIGKDGRIVPDSAVRGPSGEISLKMESETGKTIGLYSEPFNVGDPEIRYSASFAVRGNGEFIAEVITEKRNVQPLNRTLFQAGSEWKRIEVPFDPPADAPAFALHLRGSGKIWLDAFRVAPESEKGYRPMMRNEVSLAFPESSASEARIQFPDEKPELCYYVSGELPGKSELRASVTNLYGESVSLPAIPVTAENRSGTIRYDRFPKRPFGQFRVEVQLFRNGKAVSPVNEMVATRIVRPRYWGKDAPDSAFGVHVVPQKESLLAAKASGANWARLHDAGHFLIGWAFLEPEKGRWLFRDKELTAYRNAGLMLLGELGTAPEWASYFDPVVRCDSGYFKQYFAPRRVEEFAHYARTVAKRYRGVIDEWFIWNEPWYAPFFAFGFDRTGKKNPSRYWSAPDAPEQYAALSAAAYDAVKEVNPDAVVCGFNTRGFDPNRWSERVYDAGAMRKCDALDYHFYAGRLLGYPNDDYAREAWQSAFGYIEQKEGGKISKPIYMTEGQGSPESAGSSECRYIGLLKHTIPWEGKEDYHWLTDRNARLHLSLLAIGVKRIFVYSMHGNRNFVERARLRVMVNTDGYPGPMLAGHSALTSRLEDKQYAGTRILEPGFGAYAFSDGKSSTVVLSGKNDIRGRRVSCALPNASAADLYGNPIDFPVCYDGRVIFIEAPVPAEKLKQSLSLQTGPETKRNQP